MMRAGILASAISCLWASVGIASAPFMLVTKEEAARPNAPAPITRSLFPGPTLKLTLPMSGALERPLISPIHFRIEFTPRNGAAIDISKVKLTYLKSPSVDLTPRILSSLSAKGIDIANMRLPPGQHSFQLSVVDDHGRQTEDTYTLLVAR